MDKQQHRGKGQLDVQFTRFQDVSVIDAAETFSRWTLPTVFPQDNSGMQGQRTSIKHDYQSQMAILINGAATKVANALFPQGAPFFRFVNSDEMSDTVASLGEVGSVLSVQSSIELEASNQVFQRDGYANKLRAIKLLMITGNALEYYDAQRKRSHIYSVRDYAVKRDGLGDVMAIILREKIAACDLPDDFRQAHFPEKEPYDDCILYTGVHRKSSYMSDVLTYRYEVTQQVEQIPFGEPSTYPVDELPYIVLTWDRMTGENYGRGLVEQYAGDIARLSELTKALTLYEVEAMRFVNVSSSASGLDIDSFAKAEIGEVVQTAVQAGANPGIWAYEGGEYNKIQVMQEEITQLQQTLARAFMYSANMRTGDRITAFELRQNAQEAQNALGDAYSNLSDSWLTRLAYLYVVNPYPQFKPMLDLEVVKLEITVGTASLNKAAQADRLLEATQSLQLIGPVLQQLTKRTNVDALIDTVFDHYGVKSSDFFYTEEQLQAMQQQEQVAAAQQQAQQQATLQAADPTVAAQQLGLIQ